MNKTDVLNQMNGRTITNGWDVVCAMSASHISSLFKDKYDKGEQSGLPYKIECTEKFELGSISVDFSVGPPLISFIANDPTRCTLRLEIKNGESDLMDTSGKVVDKQIIPSGPDDKNKYYITAIIPLATIEGTVKNGHDVVIDFGQTESVHIDLKFSDTIKQYASNAVKNYFADNLEKKDWSLGTLIYDENPELVQLTPTEFEFATSVRPGDKTDTGCLMLFITTKGGTKGKANELTGKDGRLYTPYPDDHSAALIISNRLFYEQILLPQMPSKPAQWKFKAGESQLLAGSIQTSGGSIKYEGYSCMGQDQWTINGFKLNCNTGNPPLSLIAGSDSKLNFQWKYSWKVPWRNEQVDLETGDVIRSSGETPMDLSIIHPTVTISVGEPKQIISFKNDATAKITGPSEPDSAWAKIVEWIFGKSVAWEVIQEKINNELPQLNIAFKGVNVFAISNLLFPSDHIITYDADGVLVPGDLVLLGTTKQKL